MKNIKYMSKIVKKTPYFAPSSSIAYIVLLTIHCTVL